MGILNYWSLNVRNSSYQSPLLPSQPIHFRWSMFLCPFWLTFTFPSWFFLIFSNPSFAFSFAFTLLLDPETVDQVLNHLFLGKTHIQVVEPILDPLAVPVDEREFLTVHFLPAIRSVTIMPVIRSRKLTKNNRHIKGVKVTMLLTSLMTCTAHLPLHYWLRLIKSGQ